MRICCFGVVALVASLLSVVVEGAEPTELRVVAPVPYQVIQRVGFVPQRAHAHEPGGPALGFADVEIALAAPPAGKALLEGRVLPVDAGNEPIVDWKSLISLAGQARARWQLRVPAGGWYRMELRQRDGETTVALGSVEPVGVGDILLIAGQSYATNTNEDRLRVADPAGRVTAFDVARATWAVAHDPQPAPDSSAHGSIWPAFGDLLVPHTRVPVGLVNVAWGGTSSQQWLPGGELHARLVAAGGKLGRFRAVLWQQGESDVIGKVATDDYVKNLRQIRDKAVEAWGFSPPWLLAKSTLHPTVYVDPIGEGRIRQAIDSLWALPGFRPGPDTDVLGGENRGDPGSLRHFSAIGQQRAAALWFAAVWAEINRPRPEHEVVLRQLPELHLLEPVWSAPVVHRESSVLIQSGEGAKPAARLAFPAEELLEVHAPASGRRFDLKRDVTLTSNGTVLQFQALYGIEPVLEKDFFPPRDAPHSYRHRAGHPEQNLLYQPGRWFHDRNVEITYRRTGASAGAINPPFDATRLPRTMARLKQGQPLTLAISGDSISTGLDASAMTAAPPFQPGYPSLVAAQLHATFGSDVALVNRAVAGWSIAHGVEDLEALLASQPHLIVVAYGMNDVGRRDPAWFRGQVQTLIERARAADGTVEFILVAPMLGHAEWVHTPREMFGKYRDELRSLVGPGIGLADLTALWEVLLHHKHDLDLTGNGLNHPNDFGHRLYAQALMALLVERPADR